MGALCEIVASFEDNKLLVESQGPLNALCGFVASYEDKKLLVESQGPLGCPVGICGIV